MTDDQKAISLVLDLLSASKGVPRTLLWLDTEVRHAGRRCELPAILEQMTDAKLITSAKDALKIRRYTITPNGSRALSDLRNPSVLARFSDEKYASTRRATPCRRLHLPHAKEDPRCRFIFPDRRR